MPKLLDLFCGAGGAGMGYSRAGFDVTGVDIAPQKNYPFKFIQADALDYVAQYGWMFDAIHASPPCQRYSRMTPRKYRHNHPDLIPLVRFWLEAIDVPYAIENVPLAPLRNPVMVCGGQLGLKVYRHRLFESNVYLMGIPHSPHQDKTPRSGHGNVSPKGFITLSGGRSTEITQQAMGIDWMIGRELREAIPPAFTEFIGRQLIRAVEAREPAA